MRAFCPEYNQRRGVRIVTPWQKRLLIIIIIIIIIFNDGGLM
jgi:hypothetical protein